MDILPFINRNGLWYLDKPELRDPTELGFASLAMAEKGVSELLEAFAIKYKYRYKIKENMVLGFSEAPIENYDARLDRMNIEVSKEYENYPNEIENISRYSLRFNESLTQNLFTTTRLLKSHRIALPPPTNS